ncbi:MAG: hypothetical protein PQJ47_04205 [Sphaerochaetaceae bacterium]|nr:hypothetical protein [Sphaerochaetaceae bacterium]
MRKIITVVSVLLCACTFIFSSVTLTLQSQVDGENFIKLSSSPLRNGHWWNNEDEDLTLTYASAAAQTAYVNLRTNSYTEYFVNLSGAAMSASGSTTKIGYTITPVAGDGYSIGSPLEVDNSGSSSSVTHFVTFPRRHGMRVVPAEFSAELDSEDWGNAGEGDYSADVTFTLVTN